MCAQLKLEDGRFCCFALFVFVDWQSYCLDIDALKSLHHNGHNDSSRQTNTTYNSWSCQTHIFLLMALCLLIVHHPKWIFIVFCFDNHKKRYIHYFVQGSCISHARWVPYRKSPAARTEWLQPENQGKCDWQWTAMFLRGFQIQTYYQIWEELIFISSTLFARNTMSYWDLGTVALQL